MAGMATPIGTLELFPELRNALLALLAALSDDEWTRPTVCPGWSVKDVALHLLGGDIAGISRRRDGLSTALDAYVRPGENLARSPTLVAALNAWNEDWVIATRRISPRLLREFLAMTGDALYAYYRGLDLMATGGAVSWAGPEPAPVWLDIAREYTEQWMHQAQIRDAVGIGGIRERRLFAPVIATFMYALPPALHAFDAPEGTRLRVVIAGDAGGAWDAVRVAGRWQLETATADALAARATLDAEAAWRLWTKGLAPDAAARVVQMEGDPRLGDAVRAMVAFIG